MMLLTEYWKHENQFLQNNFGFLQIFFWQKIIFIIIVLFGELV